MQAGDFCEFKASLNLLSEFLDSQGYTVRPFLKKIQKERKKIISLQKIYGLGMITYAFDLSIQEEETDKFQ